MKPFFLKTKIFLIVFIISFILFLNFYKKEVKNFFYLISSPIQEVFWNTGESISDSFQNIFNRENLEKDNEKLRTENQELLLKTITLKELEKENNVLRQALKVGINEDFELVFASITAKDISEDTILINKGSNYGIKQGFPVITEQKVLVGKVQEVYKDFSRVILISNKNSSFDAEVLETEVLGIIKGKGDFALYLDLIPQEQEIKQGDLLVTADLKGIFPQGLLVGKISKIIKSDVKPFQQAEIEPAFNIKDLRNLFIITRTK